MVEFALILPIFLLILGGLLDFGTMLFARMTLINATREAARWAVVQPDTSKIDSNGSAPFGIQDSGGALGVNLSGIPWARVTVALTCVDAAGGTCDFTTGANKAVRGDSIVVATSYSYQSFFASLFGSSMNLGTQVRMVLEVPS
jgi:Flp pilus assembly protein TadG